MFMKTNVTSWFSLKENILVNKLGEITFWKSALIYLQCYEKEQYFLHFNISFLIVE